MSILQFILIGDLDESKTQRLQNAQALFQERCHPMAMVVRGDKKETRIGRKNSKMPPDYALESALSNRMISRNHVTIERLSKGNFMLYDHSLNGTYVNYCRVIGGTVLKKEDIVCFGHINGANIKPGESVTPFSTDLKYRVEIIERGSGDRQDARCQQFSASSDDDVAKSRIPTESRKRMKVTKPPSDPSDHSSDSSDLSNSHQSNNYTKRKKPQMSEMSSSEDEHQKPVNRDRSIYKKSSSEKIKKHSSGSQPPESGRFSESARKPKGVPQKIPTETGPPKLNYQKKPHESKRPKLEDDRRNKERKMHNIVHKSSHSKSKYNENINKSAKRNSNVNSNYDYEECSAQPCRRPDGENLIDWIMCDKCNQWFHQFCVGLDEAVEDDESYYCPYCANE